MKKRNSIKKMGFFKDTDEDNREIFDPDDNLYNDPSGNIANEYPMSKIGKGNGQTFSKNDEKNRFDEI